MVSNIPYELNKFKEHTKLLKQVKKETDKTFREIKNFVQFSPNASYTTSPLFPDIEYHELAQTCDKPPAIIVLGTSCYAKVCVINELLGEPILPIVENDSNVMWRMIRLKHGFYSTLSLVLLENFELAAALDAYEGTWRSVPRADIELRGCDCNDPAHTAAIAEVCLDHPLLKSGAEIICSPSNGENCVERILKEFEEDVIPIIVFAIDADTLEDKVLDELNQIKSFDMHCMPIFFIKVPSRATSELTESLQDVAKEAMYNTGAESPLRLQLYKSGLLEKDPLGTTNPFLYTTDFCNSKCILKNVTPKNTLIEDFSLFACFLVFVRQVLQYHLIAAASVSNDAHTRCLGLFINTAFDVTRDITITPKRLAYVRSKEENLFHSLLEVTNNKQDEIRDVIRNAVSLMSVKLQEEAEQLNLEEIKLNENFELSNIKDLDKCIEQIEKLVLSRLNYKIGGMLVSSIEFLKDCYVGTLKRCLRSLEKADDEDFIMETGISSSMALKQVLTAAYQLEITPQTSFTFTSYLWKKIKEAIQMLPGKSSPIINSAWKKKVVVEIINCISESRLAKNICSQFRLRLTRAHDAFTHSFRILEMRHNDRLATEERRQLKLKKVFTPCVARCVLSSTSLRDLILHGMPQLGREIGRGQYGVVYACDKWGGRGPCAVKSVVLPDDKHWNDLALEFYYTRAIPEHKRIVSVRGSVIDYSYAGGITPAVLIVMDRLQRDLYAGIKSGMSFRSRIQVAIDVVEGLRYLHSQGLIHRDIKLKNVLLNSKNRGKITDLGFCKPGVMINGSIVGTPIHMAPELFSGHYDKSVDVYAFGILFWYICAGTVRLPGAYEQFSCKDHLWDSVRRGVRPERLGHFDDECWSVMNECWLSDNTKRPLFGEIQPILENIQARVVAQNGQLCSRRLSEVFPNTK
ncbi:dual serine/threonine and tyrosine protein kinase [Hydra vulgaris]|uniref:Dual serine/threonine and tyrosine protein kinase n=1 Tax=Hydra vulgaris TaxID=6087 RepID=A0ABM4D7S4_HYDVU